MFRSSRVVVLAAMVCGFMTAPVLAQTPAPKAKTAQQERMVTCNSNAKGKTGDERKAFMSSCLKGDTASSGKKLTSSQQRMKDCNADAAKQSLKGDQRKTFMSSCLKAK